MTAIVLFLIFACLQACDILTTFHALKQPGNIEANPVGRWMMEKLGILPAMLFGKVLAITVVGWVLYLLPGPFIYPVITIINLVFIWVIANNIRAMRRNE